MDYWAGMGTRAVGDGGDDTHDDDDNDYSSVMSFSLSNG